MRIQDEFTKLLRLRQVAHLRVLYKDESTKPLEMKRKVVIDKLSEELDELNAITKDQKQRIAILEKSNAKLEDELNAESERLAKEGNAIIKLY